MRAARVKPLPESSTPQAPGPQLVPPGAKAPRHFPEGDVEIGDRRPATTVLIVAVVAVTLAFTFYSAVLLWLWFRNTGVNWMFQHS